MGNLSAKIIIALIVVAFLLLPAFFSNASLIDDIKKQIADRERELKELEQKSTQYKTSISDAQKQQKTLKSKITDLNSQLSYLENQIDITATKIDQTSLFIKKLKLEIEDQEKKLKLKKVYIASAIQTINDFDNTAMLELIISNPNLSDFFGQAQYIETLQTDIQKDLDYIQLLKSKLEDRKGDQETKEDELQDLKGDLSAKKQITDSQKSEKENLLKQTKNNESNYQKLLKETNKKIADTQKEIYDFEDKLRLAIDLNSIPAPRKGLLAMPANGYISQGYGMTSYAKSGAYGGAPHNGVDIANSAGTIITAARDGKVVAVNNAPYAYGKWIAIDHENGLMTLYGHLSLQSVSAGQRVKEGQKIGYMGSTGYSTGSHLHFGVYATNTFSVKQSKISGMLPVGGSVNPLDYLP